MTGIIYRAQLSNCVDWKSISKDCPALLAVSTGSVVKGDEIMAIARKGCPKLRIQFSNGRFADIDFDWQSTDYFEANKLAVDAIEIKSFKVHGLVTSGEVGTLAFAKGSPTYGWIIQSPKVVWLESSPCLVPGII